MRNILFDVIATWNEEAMGRYEMQYVGDTTATSESPNTITVVNVNRNSTCGIDEAARAGGSTGGGPCQVRGTLVRMFMQSSCVPYAPRQWYAGWAGQPAHPFGVTGRTSYETILTHEIGHALGLQDGPAGSAPGVMRAWGSEIRAFCRSLLR